LKTTNFENQDITFQVQGLKSGTFKRYGSAGFNVYSPTAAMEPAAAPDSVANASGAPRVGVFGGKKKKQKHF
jgi:hypothetical protein